MKVPEYSPPVAQIRRVQQTIEEWEGGESTALAERILCDLYDLMMSRVWYAAAIEFPAGRPFLTGPHRTVLDASKEVKFMHGVLGMPTESGSPKARVFTLYP